MNERRRQFLASVGAALGATSLAGCQGLVAGRPRWEYTGALGVYAQPAIDPGRSLVFFVNSYQGLVALDRNTGEERWIMPMEEEGGQSQSGAHLYEGSVITGGPGGTVQSVAADDGTVDWQFPTEGGIESTPIVADGAVVVGSTDYRAYAIEADTGTERWSFETGDEVWATPTVVDDTVYIASKDSSVYAIDVASGEPQWSVETDEAVFRRLVATEDTVFGEAFTGFVYAFDADSGDVQRWDVPTEVDVRTVESPALQDGRLFVVESGGIVHALDAATGEHRWKVDVDGGRPYRLAVDDRTLVLSSNTTVYALSPSSGRRRWSFSMENEIFARPRLTPDSIYAATSRGRLYRLRRGVF